MVQSEPDHALVLHAGNHRAFELCAGLCSGGAFGGKRKRRRHLRAASCCSCQPVSYTDRQSHAANDRWIHSVHDSLLYQLLLVQCAVCRKLRHVLHGYFLLRAELDRLRPHRFLHFQEHAAGACLCRSPDGADGSSLRRRHADQ